MAGRGTPALGIHPHPIEKDRLADSSQTDQQHAPRLPGSTHPFDSDVGRLEEVVTARKVGRRSACARSERVGDAVHGSDESDLRDVIDWR
jgi:hypothetical protein